MGGGSAIDARGLPRGVGPLHLRGDCPTEGGEHLDAAGSGPSAGHRSSTAPGASAIQGSTAPGGAAHGSAAPGDAAPRWSITNCISLADRGDDCADGTREGAAADCGRRARVAQSISAGTARVPAVAPRAAPRSPLGGAPGTIGIVAPVGPWGTTPQRWARPPGARTPAAHHRRGGRLLRPQDDQRHAEGTPGGPRRGRRASRRRRHVDVGRRRSRSLPARGPTPGAGC
jgi:hypothetical protein